MITVAEAFEKFRQCLELSDIDWMNDTLKLRAPRISVRHAGEPPADSEEEQDSTAKVFDID